MTQVHGIAVVGCGRMGRRRAETAARHPSARLVGVADTDTARAQEVAAACGCAASADPARLFADADVDTVFVCTPNAFHARLAVAAMQAGKHVICEKPLACTPADAADMARQADANSVTLKVGSNLRFFSNIRKARDLVDAGEIGSVLFLRGAIGNSGWPREDWFADPPLSGGGTVIDNGCHMFDLVRWFLGDIVSCVGQVMNLHWELPVEDNGIAIFASRDGRSASVHSSWTEWQEYFSLEIYGSLGVVHVENRRPAIRTTLISRQGVRQVFDFGDAPLDAYDLELDAYIADREAGVVPQPSATDGCRVVEMAHAVYESSRLGRKVLLE